MNIDLLKFGSHTKTADYLDNLFSHGFLPLITKPTRLSNSYATLIDHIYTNDIYNKGHTGIITTDVADYFGFFYLSHGKIKQVKNQIKKKELYQKQIWTNSKSVLMISILNQLNKLCVQMKHIMYLWHFINLHLKIHFHCAINQLIRSQLKENHVLQQAYWYLQRKGEKFI